MGKLSGKIAIVAGGTGGLGKVVSVRLLQEGAAVIITHSGSPSSKLFIENISEQYPILVDFQVDTTSESSVRSFYEAVMGKYKRVHILCNLVGGVGTKAYIEETSFDEWKGMISLNLHSCFLMMREALRTMKGNQWGRIINIAAMPAITPVAKRGGYSVAKAGVIQLTKTASEEIKEYKDITVNAIAPSIILTEENKKWGTEADFEKWVTPEQIGEMIVHLCSENGTAFNGQIFQMYGKV